MTESLNNKFSLAPNDPVFGQSIFYNRVEGFNGVYFSTLSGNKRKLSIIKQIARILGIEVFVHTIE
jgi:hypothetical protein